MKPQQPPFAKFLDALGKPREIAAEIGENYETVRKWRSRGLVPAKHWPKLMEAALKRGQPVSSDTLLSWVGP